ncbi:MAG: peptidase U34 [Chloroflexi bacterium HGW-Chloroflexi-8]|nr:MAG: peptidase U34 [Chloroflexi bacterium HGW-Chloroflexi-8]
MCDTFVVLQDATKDGSIIFGKNSDRDPNEPHYVEIIPAKDFPDGSMLNCTYVSIPQVTHTHRILLCRPVWIWGAEMGVNEFGVVIGNEAIFSKIPANKEPGLIGMDYLRLALERARNAYEALMVIVNLLEKYGQSGNCGFSHPFYYHNSYLICDNNEAWKLETVDKQWAAKKINKFGSISNGLTIGYEWDLCSKDLVNFAVDRNLYKKNLRFNFSDAYSDWLFTRFSNSLQRRNCTSNQISSLAGRFDLEDSFRILRTHHDNESKFSPARGYVGSDVCMHAGFGPIRVSQTTGSLVTKKLNEEIDIWITGSSAPCISLFKPCSINQEQIFQFVPERNFESNSYWWRHEKLHRKMLTDYQNSFPKYQVDRDKIEHSFIVENSKRVSSQEKVEFWDQIRYQSNELLDNWVNKLEFKDQRKFLTPYYITWTKNNREAKLDF